jgi:hypothetical protein
MDKDTYLFHQTPVKLAADLIKTVPLVDGDVVYEPFRGEGAFYNSLPDFVVKKWAEIEEGKDFKDETEPVDWVISNPPFSLKSAGGKKENAFWKIILHFLPMIRKGVAFLGNDYCLTTLTPKRLSILEEMGFSITNLTVCNVKKWRGRYFFIIVQKTRSSFYRHLTDTY